MDWKDEILGWLEEERLQAEKRPQFARYKVQTLKKAAGSIKKGCASVSDIGDLKGLPGVGEKTLAVICKRWERHLQQNPSIEKPASFVAVEERPRVLATSKSNQSYPFAPPPPSPKKKKRASYIPKYGSAPYFVLLTLRQFDKQFSDGVGQTELQRLVKSYTPAILQGAVSRSTPSIGIALKTLREHELVYLVNGRFFLEQEGRELADRLQMAMSAASPANGAEKHSEVGNLVPETSNEIVEWPSGSFKTRLVLDTREVASRQDRSGLANDLKNLGLDVDVAPLSVGDCLWVAEHKSGRRAVLDWIVERKTLADLRASIHDGRFQEQKQRLAKSTIQNTVYLVEIPTSAANAEMWRENKQKFLTALSQTLVRHNFFLKLTRSQNETVKYLAQLTEMLSRRYAAEQLQVLVPQISNFEHSMGLLRSQAKNNNIGIDYSAFHSGLSKSRLRTVGETFQLMLRAVKGVSREKAMAIQRIFPTPKHLSDAYKQAGSADAGKRLLFEASRGCVRRQQIPLPLSAAIYDVWAPNI